MLILGHNPTRLKSFTPKRRQPIPALRRRPGTRQRCCSAQASDGCVKESSPSHIIARLAPQDGQPVNLEPIALTQQQQTWLQSSRSPADTSHRLTPASSSPPWLQQVARVLAGSIFFLGVSALSPADRAHAAALQPPAIASVLPQLAHLPRAQQTSLQQPLQQAQQLTQQQQLAQQTDLQSGPPASAGASASEQQPVQQADDLLPSEQRVVSIFESNRQSVVNISHVRSMHHFYTLDLNKMAVGQGSGFIWDRAGHVVVAAHTVKGASEVKVTLHDQSTATARVVGTDTASDIAVLQLALPRTRTEALRPVVLGSSSGLRIGQSVWVIGNPWGLEHTLSQGIVSGLGREMGAGLWALKNAIQTDAAINTGNSSGPLLDSKGRVIGVAIAMPEAGSRGGSSCGVGHAVPIDAARRIVEQLLAHGRVKRPSMGVVLAPQQVLRSMGLEGVLILEVPAGSPAAAAGLRATYRDVFGDVVLGDMIVGIDTRPVRTASELISALDDKRPGDRVRCDVLRDGKRLSMTVLLGERVAGSVEE